MHNSQYFYSNIKSDRCKFYMCSNCNTIIGTREHESIHIELERFIVDGDNDDNSRYDNVFIHSEALFLIECPVCGSLMNIEMGADHGIIYFLKIMIKNGYHINSLSFGEFNFTGTMYQDGKDLIDKDRVLYPYFSFKCPLSKVQEISDIVDDINKTRLADEMDAVFSCEYITINEEDEINCFISFDETELDPEAIDDEEGCFNLISSALGEIIIRIAIEIANK